MPVVFANLLNDMADFLCSETVTLSDAKGYLSALTVTGDGNRNLPSAAEGTPLLRRYGKAERRFLGR